MNKRSLIFVFALSIALFLVNHWFTSQDETRTKIRTQQQQAQQAELGKKAIEDMTSRTAPLSALPITAIYEDPQNTIPITQAIKTDNQYLLLAWKKNLPKELYVKLDHQRETQKITLRIAPEEQGYPALYSTDSQALLRVAYLPDIGSSDLQLLTFSDDYSQVSVVLGEYQNNQLYVPNREIKGAALALFKSKNEYLPYGIYESKLARLSPLDNYPYFGAIIQPQFFGNTLSKEQNNEQFYVLENDYIQLVFSNIGGALSEINLPFASKENTKSVVKEIDFDRIMQKQYPNNDYYPLFSYQTAAENSKNQKLMGQLGGYYPLLRRSIMGTSRHVNLRIPPHYYLANVVSEDIETSTLIYKVKRFEKNLIEFEAEDPQRRITKVFSFPKNPDDAPYCIELSVKIDGDNRNLFLTSGVPEVELISGSFSPAIKYRQTRNQKSKVEQISLPKISTTFNSVQPDWICNSNGFFGVIIDPLTEAGTGFSAYKVPGELDSTRLSLIDAEYNIYPTQKYPGYELHVPLKASGQTAQFRIFAGPFDNAILKKIDTTYSDPATGYNPDYVACQSFHGWFAFISEPFAKFLFLLMNFFHKITTSWGISIILLTIALRIMLYPLNAWSIKSTSKMQQIAPQVTAIQEKHKKDPKRAQMEVMNLYREKGVNPLSGCFPLLIQMPFLIGMFDLLKSTFDLRGAPFIPGWINNLAAPDVLFSWNYPIIFFGTQFHLLPFLLGAVMYFQQKFSSPLPKDKKLLTDQQKQQKMMGNVMTIVFTVMFYHFPSGLNIYWLSSMLLGILQQWVMTRKKPKLQNPNIVRVK